jgi:hypothetical protein
MLPRRALAALFAASLAAPPALAETRSHLEGDVRPVAPYLEEEIWRSFFNSPGAPAATFVLDAGSAELDFRAAPGTLVVTGPGGSLTAVAGDPPTLHGVLPRDPESGRPLKAGSAEGATCPTGAEPDCWQDGDPIPFDAAVLAALDTLGAPPAEIDLYTDGASPEEQAVLGCGPYWGTDCETTGIDLTHMDASVLLQSWPGFAPVRPVVLPGARGPVAGGTAWFGRRDFVWALPGDVYPRVVDPFTGRPLLPGVRGPGLPVYLPPPDGEPLDGVVESAPAPVPVPGVNTLVRPGGNTWFGRRDFAFTGEMAALSWNFLMLLASMSGDGVAPHETGEFDPAQPMTANRCSYVTPQYCESVRVFFWFTTELLADDPSAPPALRFLWEAGAVYDVTEATGDFAPYAGGALHVLGMERARANVAEHGIPVVLFPAGETLDPSAPFAVATAESPELPSFGLAYLTAPEASSAGIVAPVVLAALARRRRGRR